MYPLIAAELALLFEIFGQLAAISLNLEVDGAEFGLV